MENEMKVIRLIQANLKKLPSQAARVRVLRYLVEVVEGEPETQEDRVDPRQLSLDT